MSNYSVGQTVYYDNRPAVIVALGQGEYGQNLTFEVSGATVTTTPGLDARFSDSFTLPNLQLEWGLQPPAEAIAAWGARAIYGRRHDAYQLNHTKAGKLRKRGLVPWMNIELLYDRQSSVGEQAARAAIGKWINEVALPKLRAEIEIDRDEDREHAIQDGRFCLKANPRSSYGYLYIVAYML